jgi:hypothetical protein
MWGCCRLGGGLDLLHEAVGAEHGGQLGPEDLEGDLAVVLQVRAEIDGGHAALAELALDAVAVGEGSLEAFGDLAQGAPPCSIAHGARCALGVFRSVTS